MSYSVWWADDKGENEFLVNDWLQLRYSRAVNDIGIFEIIVRSDKARDQILRKIDGRFSVWRRIKGTNRTYLDTETVYLAREFEYIEENQKLLKITAYSAVSLLARRIIAYSAGSSQSDKTGVAETIMKAFVNENVGSSATETARNLTTYLAVEADAARGPSISKAAARRNLLGTLRECSEAAQNGGTPIFFDIVEPYRGHLEFRCYQGQRGQDRTVTTGQAPVILRQGENLRSPRLKFNYKNESTFVYGAGTGEGAGRLVATASAASRLAESVFNRSEVLWDNTQQGILSRLQKEANARLSEGRPLRTFKTNVADVPNARYGQHWNWGDLVTAEAFGEQVDCMVRRVDISVSDNGDEDLGVVLEEQTQ